MADQTDEIVTHTISILRVAATLRREAVETLLDLQADLVAKIERYDPATLRGRRLRVLLNQTDESIAAAYREVAVNQDAGLRAIAGLEGRFAVKTLNGKLGVPLISVAIPEKVLEAVVDGDTVFGHPAKDWWAQQARDLQFKFAGAMRMGILQGETVDQLARRVRGTKAGDFQDGLIASGGPTIGLIPEKKRQAEALVRTSVIAVSNEARMRSYEEMSDVVGAIQWVSTLDSRTTDICRALSGLKWSLPDHKPIGHDKVFPGPTAHWNCRSTQIAVTKSWGELGKKKLPSLGDKTVEERMKQILRKEGWDEDKLESVKARTRASMDGPISQDLSMDEWMEGKSKAFLDSTLGVGKADLFRAGKITMADLTDQMNRPLTVAELKKRYA